MSSSYLGKTIAAVIAAGALYSSASPCWADASHGDLGTVTVHADEPYTLPDVVVVGSSGDDYVYDWYTNDTYSDASYGDSGGSTSEGGTQESEDPEPKMVCDNPVDIITGKKLDFASDFASVSNDGLEFKRTYNQAWSGYGMLGMFWISNFDLKLSFNSMFSGDGYSSCYPSPGVACNLGSPPYTIFAHRADGDVVRFTQDVVGHWKGSEEVPLAAIAQQADGTYKLTWPTGDYEVYDGSGFLAQRKNADNVGITLTYDATYHLTKATHTSGRNIQFTWNGDMVATVIDPAGKVYSYAYMIPQYYTTLGMLANVAFPDAKGNLQYHWENGLSGFGELTGISVAGVRFSNYTYDATSHRVVHEQKANGADPIDYAYFPDRTERTNSLGRKIVYSIDANGRNYAVSGAQTAHCPSAFSEKTFDAEGRLDVLVDEDGMATNFDYDTNGRITQKIVAAGTPAAQTYQYAWDAASGRISLERLVGVSETAFTYDAAGRVKTASIKNLMNGVLNEVRTVTYTYTKRANGMLSSVKIDGPVPGTGDALTYAYATTGDLQSITNGLGHAVAYANFNALGQPGKVTTANGAVTNLTYDARGRLVSTSDVVGGVAQTTTMTYDSAGRLDTVTAPDGQQSKRTYDSAGRLVSVSEAESATTSAQTTYLYNPNSQPIEVKRQRTTSP